MKKLLTSGILVIFVVLFAVTGSGYAKEKAEIKKINQDIINLKSDKAKLMKENRQLQDEIKSLQNKPEAVSKTIKEIEGLVMVKDIDDTIIQDLRYASSNNFTKTKIYSADICALRFGTAIKLKKANSYLKKLGFRIKVYDAYRPASAQEKLWSIVPDERYVANPNKGGSNHSKGCAVDVTLADVNNREINMPTGFDDFTGKAERTSNAWSPEQRKNVGILTDAMKKAGFVSIDTEWWHFYDNEKNSYKILNVPLEDFLK